MKRSIKVRLIVIFSLIVILPVLSLGFFSSYLSHQIFESMMMSSMKKETIQVDNLLTTTLKDIDENVTYLASMPITQKADHSISHFYDRKTDSIVDQKNAPGVEGELFREFERYANSHPGVRYVYMGTIYGGYVQWPSEVEEAGYDPRKRAWYEEAAKNPGKIIRTDPYLYDSSSGPVSVISTATTVKNRSGKVIGVIGIDKSLDNLSQTISSIRIGETGYVFLMAPDGTIVAHPNKKLNFLNLEDLSTKGVKADKTGEVLSFRLSGYDQLLSSKTGHYTMQVDGKLSLVSLYTSKVTGWKIVAVVNQNELLNYSSQFKWLTAIIGLVCLIISILIGFLLSRSITNPLIQLKKQANLAANGDLTVHMAQGEREDEIGQLAESFEKMMTNLRKIIQQVSESTEHIAAFSEELTASTEQSSRAVELTIQAVAVETDKQVQSVGEGSKSVNHMSAGIQQIAASTQNVLLNAVQASDTASVGNRIIHDAVLQMNTIDSTMNEIAETVKGLGKRSQEIEKIIDVITKIAEQTNLLALNASIEAARAGEHGRGFAVVADEVRKLAEESSSSTRQIAGLVTAIQSETTKAVQLMEAGIKEAALGIEEMNAAGELFQEIQHSINKVTKQIHEVSTAAEQISANTEQAICSIALISEAAENNAFGTHNISAATQEQLASVEEVSSSVSFLANMMEELQQLVNKFKI
jgi:methyl-accepting chemotaxis protein